MIQAVMTDRFRSLLKHAFLVVLLGLLINALVVFFRIGNYGYSAYGGVAIGLGLLINHLAFFYVKVGWQGKAMRWLAYVWVTFTLVYVVTVSLSVPVE